MTYQGRTQFYGIPVPGKGEKISSAEEMRKANIIENQLIAGTKGILCCVFEDGEYTVELAEDGEKYNAHLFGTGDNKALIAIVNGGLVVASDSVTWEGLRPRRVYHLYVQWTEQLYADETAFVPQAYNTTRDPLVTTLLYLAKVDLTGDTPVIEREPDGKLYSGSIEYHVQDDTNPHGSVQWQEKMVILKELAFERGSGDDRVLVPVITERNAGEFQKITTVVDGDSAGLVGVDVAIDGANEILFAVVSQRYTGTMNFLGNVSVGYYGQDEKVRSRDAVRVYNDGEVGVPIRVMVTYR